MRIDLFKEFDEISAKQWKQKIQVDLKGEDYNQTLVWESNEGISVKPFYHYDDHEALEIPHLKEETCICQQIYISDEKVANSLAKDALSRGANAILFESNEPFDIEQLLNGLVLPTNTSIYFKLKFLSESFCSSLSNSTKRYRTFLNIDPIGYLTKSGNWFINKNTDLEHLEHIFLNGQENATIVSIDAGLYQNAGANNIQQIAYALAHANEYLNHFNAKKLIAKLNKKAIQFNFSVGSNYFFEIAKLRAFRYVWKLLCDEYNVYIEPHIFVTPSLRNKTLYDYNTNMLRTTTECMSAILGGANAISNIAYDTIYHKKNEFGERIARNQLLVLQEESYFKEAAQIAEGSYYIESLTKQLADKGLSLFKEIENSGGFQKQLFDGTIQRKIAESATKEQLQFDAGKIVLLGTNKHPNSNDKIQDELELYPFVKVKPRKTLIQPIISVRLSEELEKARLKKE